MDDELERAYRQEYRRVHAVLAHLATDPRVAEQIRLYTPADHLMGGILPNQPHDGQQIIHCTCGWAAQSPIGGDTGWIHTAVDAHLRAAAPHPLDEEVGA